MNPAALYVMYKVSELGPNTFQRRWGWLASALLIISGSDYLLFGWEWSFRNLAPLLSIGVIVYGTTRERLASGELVGVILHMCFFDGERNDPGRLGVRVGPPWSHWILFLTGAMNPNRFSEITLSGLGACGMDLNAIGYVTTWLLEGPRNGDRSNPYIVLLMLVLELLVRWPSPKLSTLNP